MLIGSRDKILGSYDVIIIGSGLAGLTAANKLAMNGRSVLLLEAHNKLGGFATWFKRSQGNHVFDVSLHGFPGAMIKTCKKYWNQDIANSIVKIKGVRFVNPMFDLETDFTKDDFIFKLISKFGCSEQTVHSFFKYLDSMNFYDPPEMTNRQLFEMFFPNRPDVVRFLLEPIVYANGSNLDDPAITYGIVFSNFMKSGVYTFQGGTDNLIFKMRDELIKNGVDIRLQSKVEKILVENRRVFGVQLDGQNILSKAVLSNSNLLTTVEDLVGIRHFSPLFIEKVKKVRLNTSSCQVYIGIKKGEQIPRMKDLIFYSEDFDFSTERLLDVKIGSQTFSLYYPDCRHNDRYAVVSSSNARYEDWEGLSEPEYAAKKEYLIAKAISSLERVIPGVTSKIDFVEAATPLTVQRYTLHKKGSSFGTKFEGLWVSMNMHKEIDGLFHAGSVGIIMSGWLGAANYGVIQSHEVENFL